MKQVIAIVSDENSNKWQVLIAVVIDENSINSDHW